MIRLLILLLGAEAVRRRWLHLTAIGALWVGFGVFTFLDAIDADTLIPVWYLGYFLLVEAVLTLLAATVAEPGRRRWRLIKGSVFVLVSLLTIDHPWHSDLLVALLIGVLFAIDGGFRIASAVVVRHPHWRGAMWAGIVEVLIAIGTLQPWPSYYVGTIGCNIGLALAISGLATMRLGLRLRRLPAHAPISSLFSRFAVGTAWPEPEGEQPPEAAELVVHVWTPAGSAEGTRRGLISRYIAAVDRDGVISTGHAALELLPDVYISHYPAVDLDRNPADFARTLRATAENDVPGRFLPDYRSEADGWCEANAQVRFRHFDAARLRAFWAAYRADTTYNLTHRNCSSAVANALDAALEGAMGQHRPAFRLLRAMLMPELWVAGVLRQRAEAMAWTPGLLLDYARALWLVVEPPPSGWGHLLRRLVDRRASPPS
ncbi:MAG: protease [Rhodospirillales bacterium 69-11]|nr:protease [Rhodospirillales bacterium]OJW24100.1 MAG: protease [Rhodospirillales bacterium 69-11]